MWESDLRITNGPLTAYSIFLMLGFILSKVIVLAEVEATPLGTALVWIFALADMIKPEDKREKTIFKKIVTYWPQWIIIWVKIRLTVTCDIWQNTDKHFWLGHMAWLTIDTPQLCCWSLCLFIVSLFSNKLIPNPARIPSQFFIFDMMHEYKKIQLTSKKLLIKIESCCDTTHHQQPSSGGGTLTRKILLRRRLHFFFQKIITWRTLIRFDKHSVRTENCGDKTKTRLNAGLNKMRNCTLSWKFNRWTQKTCNF